MKESKRILLHLSLIPGVGPAAAGALINGVNEVTLADIYNFTASDFIRHINCTPKLADTFVRGLRETDLLERELELLYKYGFEWVDILDEYYPEMLKHIYLPPIGLYVRGSCSALQGDSLAIVGSRQADQYGKRAVDRFVPRCVVNGYTIVSGGALGLDTMAHHATLACGGTTVSVLGSGLLRPSPMRNTKLFDAIVQSGGAIVSSFALQTDALAGNFPARNRIIAGMSQACFVVQAAAKSGARITAQFALDQGKDVYALPGSWDHSLSQGCHELIAQGAIIASSPEALFESTSQESEAQQELFDDVEPDVASMPLGKALRVLCRQPASVDALADATGKSVIDVQSALFNLQLEGQVVQNFAGLWHVMQ